MAEKNIQIREKDGANWNELYPKTKASIVTTNSGENVEAELTTIKTGVNNKVDKVAGKQLSTNDYTNADKSAIANISNKVDKVVGKQLSTNDFTNSDKQKLDGLNSVSVSDVEPSGGLWFEEI